MSFFGNIIFASLMVSAPPGSDRNTLYQIDTLGSSSVVTYIKEDLAKMSILLLS